MSRDVPSLDRIQRWLQSVIMHPLGVAAGVDSAEARSQIDVAASDVEQVIERSQSLTSLERLEVYGNAYYGRLLECLREEYPALNHAAGDETFQTWAFGYLQAHPSCSYTLAQLGARFPDYLAETSPPPEADQADPTVPADWAGFFIELARLERLYSEVFDGLGVETTAPLTAADLLAIPAECWGDARLIPVPCLRLLKLSYPVHEYITSVRQSAADAEIRFPAPSATYLAVTRREFVVRRYALSETQFALLESLTRGTPLGVALEEVAIQFAVDLPQFARDLPDWFREWTVAPFFNRVLLEESPA